MDPNRRRALLIGWKKEPAASEYGNGQRPGSENAKTHDCDRRLASGSARIPQHPEQRAYHSNSASNDKDGEKFARHVSSIPFEISLSDTTPKRASPCMTC